MAKAEVVAELCSVARELSAALRGVEPGPPVAYVYNPLDYAEASWLQYVERWARPPGAVRDRALLLGMNPGPWGMAQTGVPFGAVGRVRDWLGIDAPVDRPPREHPSRPVLGFACTRQEVSGDRLWAWAQERFTTPERFFARFFVWNYCPLLFLAESGRNVTPDKLRAEVRQVVLDPCDRALRRVVELLGCPRVIGVGAFAEERARAALDGLPVRVDRVLHPSPASPVANRGWAEQASAQLRDLGLDVPEGPQRRR
ncbi:MAG TPA: single-stranded DNA-binding protein [Thermoanaerobaculia bacterium]|nr:single-stranded DNA-binding protein [Thermoanaerobaculia bacterium]